MACLCYIHNNTEKIFSIPDNKRVTVGRDEEADIRVEEDNLISRKHFAIEKDATGEFIVIDLGARNGTFFNGKRLSGERIQLRDRDEIKAGRHTFTFFEKEPQATPERSFVLDEYEEATQSFENPEEAVKKISEIRKKFLKEIEKVIIGQKDIINHILIAMLCRGHCLLIGAPGLAKTLIVRTLSAILDLNTNRIQFTPDLMPADITGTDILEEDSSGARRFRFNYGPVFTNILLADEINRTPPKTQAALLEAMQEQKVTASGVTYKLPQPFFVLATQNPIEQEGTYPLPEAQLDRFMFCLILNYPDEQDEVKIILETTRDVRRKVNKIINAENIINFQKLVRQVPVSDHVAKYAAKITRATRPGSKDAPDFVNKWVRWGAGPRAGQYLLFAAKAHALLQGKFNVSVNDVRLYALPVLRHRVICNFLAGSNKLSSDDIIRQITEVVEV